MKQADGEGKGTRLELFAEGVAGLEPEIVELIRAAWLLPRRGQFFPGSLQATEGWPLNA